MKITADARSASAAVSSSCAMFSIRKWLLRSLGLLIFTFLMTRVDLGQIGEHIRQADLGLVVAALLLTFPFFAVKGRRWQLLLNAFGIFIAYRRAFSLYLLGLFAGHQTPGQIGEMVKVYYLRRASSSPWLSAWSIVLDRLLDLGLLVVLAVPALWVFNPLVSVHLPLWATLIMLGVMVAFLTMSQAARKRSGGLAFATYHWIRKRIHNLLAIDEGQSSNVVRQVPWASVIGLTVMSSIVNYIRFYLLLVSLHLEIPMLHFVTGLALVWLVSLLPISVAGIGTRDLALVALFSPLGISGELALSFSFLILGLYLFQMILGLTAWLVQASSAGRD